MQDSGQVHNAVRPKIICILSIELGSVKEIAMVVENLGNTSHTNKCFLSGIARITSPLLSGNLYIFFGRHKGIYKVYFLIQARPSPPPHTGNAR